MDVSLESKSLPSVGYSRKSYLQTTFQRLARGKLVNLHGRRSLALPSVGPGDLKMHKRVAKSLQQRLFSQGCEVGCKITSQQKGDFATLCKMLPSAWSDRLEMAVTPSFQLRIAHCLKHWILEFLSFEMCPTIPMVREMFGDCNTYNSNWRTIQNSHGNHNRLKYKQHVQATQQASNLEQAMVNLSKVMGDFVGAQKSINAHLNQRIDSREFIEQKDG
ncbi:hypothetical protein AAG906_031070 [Vitis piasezkii]